MWDGKTHSVKPLKYVMLPGLSENQLKQHHDVLYAGYVKKLIEIEEKLKTAPREDANATFSLYGELRRAEGFATNAIYLHEGYFDNLGQQNNAPSGDIVSLVKEDFGSWDAFANDFAAAGLAARGWVILAYNWFDKRLHIYSTDYHTQGVWNASPLLILDVYEHAYFIDYGTGRKKYIEQFMKIIDWAYVNGLVKEYGILEHRGKK